MPDARRLEGSAPTRRFLEQVYAPKAVTNGKDKEMVLKKLLAFTVKASVRPQREQTLGRYLDEEGRYDEALQHYAVALELYREVCRALSVCVVGWGGVSIAHSRGRASAGQ